MGEGGRAVGKPTVMSGSSRHPPSRKRIGYWERGTVDAGTRCMDRVDGGRVFGDIVNTFGMGRRSRCHSRSVR